MPRKRIPKNPGRFTVELSMVKTYLVSNDRRGGNGILIPCRDKKQAEELCEKLNKLDPKIEHEIWY